MLKSLAEKYHGITRIAQKEKPTCTYKANTAK